jgi:hypothetical protein
MAYNEQLPKQDGGFMAVIEGMEDEMKKIIIYSLTIHEFERK